MDYEMLVMLITGEYIPERVEEAITKGYLRNVLGTLVVPQNVWYDIHTAREDLLEELLEANRVILSKEQHERDSVELSVNTRKVLNLRKIKPMRAEHAWFTKF